jgi:type IV pilus assembly protein PilB
MGPEERDLLSTVFPARSPLPSGSPTIEPRRAHAVDSSGNFPERTGSPGIGLGISLESIRMSNRLGELLVREKLISLQQLRTAQEESRRNNTSLGYQLARMGFISDQEITEFLSQQYRVQSIDLNEFEIDEDVRKLVSQEVCERHRVIPVSRAGSSLIVAMADPSNLHAIDDIKFLTGYNVEPVVASETAILKAIEQTYAAPEISYDTIMEGFDEGDIEVADLDDEVNLNDLERASEDAPVVRLCNAILLNAIKKRASDIHIEPYERKLRVRYRIDGVLHEEMTPPLKLKNAIASRLKIMSSLDIAERRLPQDGRIKLKLGKGREMDFRVSSLPTIWGEKLVLRLLDKTNLQLDMTKLGFSGKALADFKWAISQPYGMVLVTGPTGSGKTTTLYSALSELNQPDTNISTAEDPVEYNLMGINQVQMHDDIGLNFAAALRSFLRQDPDIIMVGEIRDFETAEIGVKAALTGHLVLSTLHTNDAPSTVSRLLNMGIEPFLVTASVNLVLAQRLARKICEECRTEMNVDRSVLVDVGVPENELAGFRVFKGAGCRTCGGTGYKGRIALYEVMPFTERLKELVLQGVSTAELKDEMIREGVATLRMAGIEKIKAGVTTIDEVLRVTAADRR